jgi:hypothetical protein
MGAPPDCTDGTLRPFKQNHWYREEGGEIPDRVNQRSHPSAGLPEGRQQERESSFEGTKETVAEQCVKPTGRYAPPLVEPGASPCKAISRRHNNYRLRHDRQRVRDDQQRKRFGGNDEYVAVECLVYPTPDNDVDAYCCGNSHERAQRGKQQ